METLVTDKFDVIWEREKKCFLRDTVFVDDRFLVVLLFFRVEEAFAGRVEKILYWGPVFNYILTKEV